jgi:23S rRNA (guanine745-N1)-methyltransferase
MTASILLCPVCKESLHANESNKSLSCDNNHSFDRARQGYLNLLLAHKKKSKNPGDSQAMVSARQAFLNSDFYRPISDSLNQIIVDAALKLDSSEKELSKSEKAIQVLDIGCGEGYYSQRMHNSLNDHQIEHNLFGLDISKDAVIAAAKRAKAEKHNEDVTTASSSEWLVASAIDIPLQAQSIDIATCLFTRLMPESYHKVIKQDGLFICVNTGEKHLIELREKLYDKITKTEFDPVKNMGEDFELVDHQQVSYTNTLGNQQQIQDLLLMTPHNWRTTAENKESLKSLAELTVTIDAQIHVFKAKEKAIVELEVEGKGEGEGEGASEVKTDLKTASSVNPWGKASAAIEASTQAINEMPVQAPTEMPSIAPTELPIEALAEMPVKAITEMPVEAVTEIPVTTKAKVNPWSKS